MNADTPLARIVCEIPRDAALREFRWYEISLDEPDASISPLVHPVAGDRPTNFIAATHARSEEDASKRVSVALDAGFRYVLFESMAERSSRQLVERVHAAGACCIATRHLSKATNDADMLVAELAGLAGTGADFIKIAYPAYMPSEIGAGLAALERAQAEYAQPVSVTPMGTTWGRVCAAAAGSRFVFAPMVPIDDRPSATDLLRWLEQIGSRVVLSEL